jgi:Tfp pilus assembly protein PilE
MSRADLGVALLVALIAIVAVISILTVRYTRYRDAVARGKRHLKPVSRPFWMA